MVIYTSYKPPPEPPEHLWLVIDYSILDFNDLDNIKMIYTIMPETYNTLNIMYKKHKINQQLYTEVSNKYDLYINPPKIIDKIIGGTKRK